MLSHPLVKRFSQEYIKSFAHGHLFICMVYFYMVIHICMYCIRGRWIIWKYLLHLLTMIFSSVCSKLKTVLIVLIVLSTAQIVIVSMKVATKAPAFGVKFTREKNSVSSTIQVDVIPPFQIVQVCLKLKCLPLTINFYIDISII